MWRDVSVHAMDHQDFEFDNPGLKAAVQRAWGDEGAPQRLRGRISRLIATAGSIDQATAAAVNNRSPWQRWQGRVYGFVAAAAVVLAVGLMVLYYRGAFDRTNAHYAGGPPLIMPSKTQVPLTLAHSMIATHSACGKLHDHRLVDGVNTYAALNLKLTANLGFPAMARSIGEEWTFKGAGECTVDGLRGAHLLFARGDQTMSVFSLPASCMSGVAPGAQYEGTVNGHAVAGFARAGAVYAVVGSSSSAALPLDAVTAIRDGLYSRFEIGCGEDPADLVFFE